MSICLHVHMSTCPVHMSICLYSYPCPWTRQRTWTFRYMNYGHVDIWTFSMSNLHVHVNTVENTHWWNILVDSVLYGGAIFGRNLSPIGEKSRSWRFFKCWQVLTSVVKTLGEPQFRSKFFCETRRKRDSLQNSCLRDSQKRVSPLIFFTSTRKSRKNFGSESESWFSAKSYIKRFSCQP